jgi:Na+(H+)/acetate symporter ActP
MRCFEFGCMACFLLLLTVIFLIFKYYEMYWMTLQKRCHNPHAGFKPDTIGILTLLVNILFDSKWIGSYLFNRKRGERNHSARVYNCR